MRALAVVVLCAGLTGACRRGEEVAPSLGVPPPGRAATSTAGTVPHGDHNPRFGGVVLMNGDLHFEVVLARDGLARVYFSDATRAELPAATASGVTITITQKSRPPEVIALHIDDSGESWTGRGTPIDDPAATARIAYTAQGKPYFIDVPVPR
jgi:hypothetical protein